VHTLLSEEYGVPKKWVIIMDRSLQGKLQLGRLLDRHLKEREGKEEEEGCKTYKKTHSDRQCQLRKNMAQHTARLDEGEEEESEVMQEGQVGRGRWEKDQDKTREQN